MPGMTNSSTALAPPRPDSGKPPALVRVSVHVPATNDHVWSALTDRRNAARWFGDLSESLADGAGARLDFGDGDFFDIEDISFDRPRTLSYRWRFLGTGPSNDIVWTVEPEAGGCRVTVADNEADRRQAEFDALSEGWTDFLARLQGLCATGRTTRYDWRRDFDGAIELPLPVDAASETLLSPAGLGRWMPWSASTDTGCSRVVVADGGRPTDFVIDGVERPTANALSFNLRSSDWRAPTVCTLNLEPRPDGCLLVVAHNGWDGIGGDSRKQSGQRERFGNLWIEALNRARALVSG